MHASDPDRDALWKPGYDGPWHVPAPDLDPASSGSGRVGPSSRQLAVSALLGLVVIATLVFLLGRNPTSETAPAHLDEDRATQAELWTATFPTVRIGALTATEDWLVVLVDRPGSLVALDRRDGSIRWRGAAPGASATGLDVVDGVVLARHVEADGRGSVVAHEVDGGLPLWRDALAVGERIDVVDGVAWRTVAGVDTRSTIDVRSGVLDGTAVSGPTGAASDNVLRGMGPGADIEIPLPGASVRVVVDGATSSLTLVHRIAPDPRTTAGPGIEQGAPPDDPTPASPASVP